MHKTNNAVNTFFKRCHSVSYLRNEIERENIKRAKLFNQKLSFFIMPKKRLKVLRSETQDYLFKPIQLKRETKIFLLNLSLTSVSERERNVNCFIVANFPK